MVSNWEETNDREDPLTAKRWRSSPLKKGGQKRFRLGRRSTLSNFRSGSLRGNLGAVTRKVRRNCFRWLVLQFFSIISRPLFVLFILVQRDQHPFDIGKVRVKGKGLLQVLFHRRKILLLEIEHSEVRIGDRV